MFRMFLGLSVGNSDDSFSAGNRIYARAPRHSNSECQSSHDSSQLFTCFHGYLLYLIVPLKGFICKPLHSQPYLIENFPAILIPDKAPMFFLVRTPPNRLFWKQQNPRFWDELSSKIVDFVCLLINPGGILNLLFSLRKPLLVQHAVPAFLHNISSSSISPQPFQLIHLISAEPFLFYHRALHNGIFYLKNSCKTINGRKHLYFACFRPYFFSPDR